MKKNFGIVDFAVYENGSEYLGLASVTLPTFTSKTLTATGAGIAGEVNIPVRGQKNATSITISFLDPSESSHKLSEDRVHDIDLRVAHEGYDPVTGKLITPAFRYSGRVIPTTKTGGTVAPASAQGASAEYSVLKWAEYVDGKMMSEYDPLNGRDVDASGNDNYAAIRAALGKR